MCKDDKSQVLLFTAGACVNGGRDDAHARWAISVGPQRVIKDELERLSSNCQHECLEVTSVLQVATSLGRFTL